MCYNNAMKERLIYLCIYSGHLFNNGLVYANLNVWWFENFLQIAFVFLKSHSQPLADKELDDLAAQGSTVL
jgi:hypothetical protein